MRSEEWHPERLSGRNRRLLSEWRQLQQQLGHRRDLTWSVARMNGEGLPTTYLVDYHLRSICGVTDMEHLNVVGVDNEPLFATGFRMLVELPPNYPCIDGAPSLRFLTSDEKGLPIAHPWHPNIRYFGDMAGRVCINMADTYTSLAWGIDRVASYLRYDLYHARRQPPFPEDLKVADWVVRQGEPNGWVFFDQMISEK